MKHAKATARWLFGSLRIRSTESLRRRGVEEWVRGYNQGVLETRLAGGARTPYETAIYRSAN